MILVLAFFAGCFLGAIVAYIVTKKRRNLWKHKRYTGFKLDKKELYEGDIIGYEYDGELISGVITFEKGMFVVKEQGYYYEKNDRIPDTLYSWLTEEKCKLIGNIYENTN